MFSGQIFVDIMFKFLAVDVRILAACQIAVNIKIFLLRLTSRALSQKKLKTGGGLNMKYYFASTFASIPTGLPRKSRALTSRTLDLSLYPLTWSATN